MSQPPDRSAPTNLFDPFGLWKQSQQAMLESWSKSMTEAVNTDAYAESTGRMLDSYLTVSAPLRKIIDQTMTQLLNQLGLPSRAEVVSLAERMTNIELRLDDLDARLDEIQRGVERTASAVAALSALSTINTTASVRASATNGTHTKDEASQSKRGSQSTSSTTARAPRTTARTATTRRRSKSE